jgi:multidrug efflux pump subunit AcrB
LANEHSREHGRLYRVIERGFDAILGGYARGLDFVLRHQKLTMAAFVATVIATGYLFVIIPKGFFPQQDTGLITGFTEAAQDVSFAEMVRRQHALTDVIVHDPDVVSVVSIVGAAAGSQTMNNGRVFITLKPRHQRSASADQLIARRSSAARPIPTWLTSAAAAARPAISPRAPSACVLIDHSRGRPSSRSPMAMVAIWQCGLPRRAARSAQRAAPVR